MQRERRMHKINPSQLEIARKSRLLTQGEVAKKIGLDQGKYSKIEKGEFLIPQYALESACEVLNYPWDYFFLNGEPELPVSLHESGNYRKRASITKKNMFFIESHIGNCVTWAKSFLKNIDIETKNSLYSISLQEHNYNIENVALQLRHQWGLPSGAIKNLSLVIENTGCIIIKSKFSTNKIDGFSVWHKNMAPLIFIRNDMPADRERFTLAHELGHLLFHKFEPLSPNKEDEANAFASAFLMPKDDIKTYLKNLNIHRLMALKSEWKVSMQALTYRAMQLGCITKEQYKYLFMQMSKLGYRKEEPVYVQPEQPQAWRSLIQLYIDELEYSHEELRDYLCISENDYINLFCPFEDQQLKQNVISLPIHDLYA